MQTGESETDQTQPLKVCSRRVEDGGVKRKDDGGPAIPEGIGEKVVVG